MARRTKEEAEETRNQILDAAERVFQENGVSRASLAEIAAAAGVTRGAIYWHFQNKTDLFRAMFDRLLLPLQTLGLAGENEGEPDPLGHIRHLMIEILRRVELSTQSRRILGILRFKCEYTGELIELQEQMSLLSRDCDRRIAKVLNNAVSRGQLPGDLDCQRAAVCLHALMVGLEHNWLLTQSFPLAEQAESLIDAALDMLRSAPALRIGQ